MADEQAVVADSAPAAETAPPEAADTQTDVTHGETAEQAPPETAEPTSESPDEEESESETPDPTLSEEEQQTKAQARRERRQAREQKRIDDAVQATLARERATESQKAATAKAEADQKAAAEAFYQQFGNLVGTPEVRAKLQADISAASREIGAAGRIETQEQLEAFEARSAQLQALTYELDTLDRNQKTYDEIDAFQFQSTQNLYAAAGADLPPEYQARLFASTNVPTALAAIKEGAAAAATAKVTAAKDAEIAEWKGRYEKEQAAHAATRTGAPGAGPSPMSSNGTGAGGSGELTYERYSAMTTQERIALRGSAEGRAKIDRMTQRRSA